MRARTQSPASSLGACGYHTQLPRMTSKVPKNIVAFLDYVVEHHAGEPCASDAASAKRVFEALYPAWKQGQKEAKAAQDDGKRRPDPVAASLGTAMKKLAALPQEERELRLAAIDNDLRERVESAAPETLCTGGALADIVTDALCGGRDESSAKRSRPNGGGAGGKVQTEARRARQAFARGADELGVPPEHVTRVSADKLYRLAVDDTA